MKSKRVKKWHVCRLGENKDGQNVEISVAYDTTNKQMQDEGWGWAGPNKIVISSSETGSITNRWQVRSLSSKEFKRLYEKENKAILLRNSRIITKALEKANKMCNALNKAKIIP